MFLSDRSMLAAASVLCGVLAATLGPAPSCVADAAPQAQAAAAEIIYLTTDRGRALLADSELDDYPLLSAYIESQINGAYCGVASAVSVLNALGVSAPDSAPHRSEPFHTQVNFFDGLPPDLLSAETVAQKGMSLRRLDEALESKGLIAKRYYASRFNGPESCRDKLIDAIDDPTKLVIVNYARGALGQRGAGHHSPLAAYDANTDRFLIYDVARHRYPPAWVTSDDLYRAMMPQPDPKRNYSRGFLFLSKPTVPAPPPPANEASADPPAESTTRPRQ